MKKIALMIVYLGKFPDYVDAFMHSLQYIPDIDVIVITDQECSYKAPNLIVYPATFEEIQARIQKKFKFRITLDRPYKLCDYKPVYGYVFEEELKGYDFWGHCDFDMVFGDVRKFLTEDVLDEYDKIYQLGHLCLYRNTRENNVRFKKNAGMDYKKVFTTRKICVFDELIGMQKKYDLLGIQTYKSCDCADISLWHDCFGCDNFHGRKEKKRFYRNQLYFWEDGRIYRAMYDPKKDTMILDEFNYIHFRQRKLKAQFDSFENVRAFYITKYGFFLKEPGCQITMAEIKKYNDFSLLREIKKMWDHFYYIQKRRFYKYILGK